MAYLEPIKKYEDTAFYKSLHLSASKTFEDIFGWQPDEIIDIRCILLRNPGIEFLCVIRIDDYFYITSKEICPCCYHTFHPKLSKDYFEKSRQELGLFSKDQYLLVNLLEQYSNNPGFAYCNPDYYK